MLNDVLDAFETQVFRHFFAMGLLINVIQVIFLIPGSPFHPKIVDPRKVYLAGSWDSVVDASNQLRLKLNEMKTLEFDTRLAGPGESCSSTTVLLGDFYFSKYMGKYIFPWICRPRVYGS
jgi:hypothetical protein